MSSRARLIGVCLLVLSPSFSLARAQAPTRLSLSVDDCAEAPLALDALRERIALELAPIDVVTDRAALDVRIEVPCGSPQVVVTIEDTAREVALRRRADLGDAEGTGRVWALALVVADLVRWVSRSSPPDPAAAPATVIEAPATPEPPLAIPARPLWSSTLGVGAATRLYTGTPTLLSGLELVLTHRWLRIAIAAMGTEIPTELGPIGTGLFVLELAARPLTVTEGPFMLGLRVAAAGGPLYASGRPARDAVRNDDAVAVVVGGALALDGHWLVDSQLGIEASLSLGFDYGADLESGATLIATTFGLRVGLAITASVPLN